MGPLLVVFDLPVVGDLLHLLDRLEEVGIEDFSAVGPVEALDTVLAQEVIAQEDLPPFPSSAKDGFAVIAADTTNPRRLIGEQTAGYVADVRVEPGTCVRITTGAPLPPGADAVIMVEYTQEAQDLVTMQRPVAPQADVRPVGQDIRSGQRVLEAGIRLGPQEIGLLASLGYTAIQAHPRPRVAVLSTGNEIVEPGRQPGLRWGQRRVIPSPA